MGARRVALRDRWAGRRDFGVTHVYDEELQRTVPVEPDEKLWPCVGTLPMGYSWSLYFCQSILVSTFTEALELGGLTPDAAEAQVLRDMRRAPQLRAG